MVPGMPDSWVQRTPPGCPCGPLALQNATPETKMTPQRAKMTPQAAKMQPPSIPKGSDPGFQKNSDSLPAPVLPVRRVTSELVTEGPAARTKP